MSTSEDNRDRKFGCYSCDMCRRDTYVWKCLKCYARSEGGIRLNYVSECPKKKRINKTNDNI